MIKSYREKLKDPRWQKKRLKVFERDKWKCVECQDGKSTLHVHHKKYHNDPWHTSMNDLCTLCEGCHNKKNDKILILKKFIKDLNLNYKIFPIPGINDSEEEKYMVEISGFNRKWRDIL